jgi:uncharacterized protein (TIGR02147 family)
MDRASKPEITISTSEILRDILARKMSRNASFSLRAFARDLGVSHTYLSLVLNGKKSLSLKKVIQFSQLLQLDEREASLFMKAGTREARGRAAQKARTSSLRPGKQARKQIEEEEKYFEFEVDRFRLLCDWYHVPILELTYTKDFQSDPIWIARRLSISPEQARNAIDRLKRLGLLEECGGKLSKTQAKLSIAPKGFEKAVRDYHQQMLTKASEILESGDPEDFEARDITASCMAIDPAKLPEARKKIDAFRRSMLRYLANGESSEVYHLNVQLFPVTGRRAEKSKAVVVKRGVK